MIAVAILLLLAGGKAALLRHIGQIPKSPADQADA